ncbi:MAG: CoA transferase [Proteobacteria bacterium]|nr:CoA transferase [Pseudomonadota bacterium]
MNSVDKPLYGIKVLTMALNVPGPVAALKLNSLGASVTKVEPPEGDHFEKLCSPWYKALCAGQRVIRLNLKSTGDREEMESLLAESDIFLTSIRIAALDHLSLSWNDIHYRHPRLCQVAMVGYPPPDDSKAGHDINYLATLGLLSPPHLPLTLLADLAGAERAVSCALALLYAREQGKGAGYGEVSLSESAHIFAEPLRYGLTAPGGILGGGLPQYNLYETKQGWVAVGALEPHFWDKLTKDLGLGRPDASCEDLGAIFITKTAFEWESWATSLDLPIVALRQPDPR